MKQIGANLNTVLLTLILGLCGWTVKSVNELQSTQAAMNERVLAQAEAIIANRAKILTVETDLWNLKVEFAALQRRP